MKKRILILASGRGSNAAAIMDHAAARPDLMEVVGLVSDRPEAFALEEARKRKVESFIIAHQNEGSLLSILRRLKPDWACLAGYKRVLGEKFLKIFWDEKQGYYRVLNVHPSLLPAFPGLHGYRQAFVAGVKISGVTVHLVDTGLDSGPIVLQAPLERQEEDSLASFEERGQRLEHQLFLRALDLAVGGRLVLKKNPEQKGNFVSIAERTYGT